MKNFPFFSITLLVASSVFAMDQEEPKAPNPVKSFKSVMGLSLIKIDGKIAIKEGTVFTQKNNIVFYNDEGTQVGELAPEKEIGWSFIQRPQNNQIVTLYDNGLGVFDLFNNEPTLQLDTDEIENPSFATDYKFKKDDPNSLVLTKKAPLGNYTYLFDVRLGKSPYKTYQTGYNAIDADGFFGVSFDGMDPEEGYARSFNAQDNKPTKSFKVPGDMKLCTPNAKKLIAGKDSANLPMVENQVFDTQTGDMIASWQIKPNWNFLTEQVSQDGRYLAQVTDNTINIYDLNNGSLAKTLQVNKEFLPFGIWFSEDNKTLITVSNNSFGVSKQKNLKQQLRYGTLAYKFSSELEKRFKGEENPNQEGVGLVNIWDINLEAPKKLEEPKKTESSWMAYFGLK